MLVLEVDVALRGLHGAVVAIDAIELNLAYHGVTVFLGRVEEGWELAMAVMARSVFAEAAVLAVIGVNSTTILAILAAY